MYFIYVVRLLELHKEESLLINIKWTKNIVMYCYITVWFFKKDFFKRKFLKKQPLIFQVLMNLPPEIIIWKYNSVIMQLTVFKNKPLGRDRTTAEAVILERSKS